MNETELIEELLADLCILHTDGLPNLQSEKSISYISEFFNKRGMWERGQTLIENLFEDDKQFKNPDLNKVIKYKTVNGDDAEGKVGNLLRRPDTEDAYKKAVATLGGEDSDSYKKAMDDLGGEGQPNRDIEGEREKKDDGGDGEEPQTGTAFDPKTKGGVAYLKGLPDTDPAKPANMKDDSEETLSAGGVVYPLGGGYYADTPGGKPKYRKATDENVDLTDFRYILEAESVVGKQVVKKIAKSKGKSAKLDVIGDDEMETAKTVVAGFKFDNLSPTEKAKVIDGIIKKNNEEFQNTKEKELFTLSLIKKRNSNINYNIMLPPGNPGSSFAENNGVYYIRLIASSNGELSKDDENKLIADMLDTPLAQSMNPKDAKRWAKIAIETAKTEANVLLKSKKYNAMIPQPDGYPQGTTMDKQNKESINRLLSYKLKNAMNKNDTDSIEHYQTQLKFLNKLQESDTGILYITNDNKIGFKHTSNKSSYADPHNNTSPGRVIDFIKDELGDDIDTEVLTTFNESLDKLQNASSGVKGDVEKFNKFRENKSETEISEENEIFAQSLKNFPVRGGTKDYLYAKGGVVDKSWFKKYAKEAGLIEPFSENDVMNAIFKNVASDKPDTSAQKIILKLSELVERTTPENIESMANKFNLPADDMQKVMDSVGMYFKETAKSRRDVMGEVHTDIVDAIQKADSKNPNTYPTNPNGDNGDTQQAYVSGYLKRMHFDSYILGERDGIASQNIGGDNVEPEYYRNCLSELSGFDGDVSTDGGRSSLVEYLKKRVRISSKNNSIVFETKEGKTVELGVDMYRTKGDSKAVMGSLGKDLQKCLKSKSKENK